MTTPSTPRKAGPFTGNGSQTAWPFTFKVFEAADVQVTIADSFGTETVLALDTDYTVTLNTNQETSPGGEIEYALASGSTLVITGNTAYDQEYDIPGGGNFNPVALENQLDRIVMQVQQLAEQLGRAVKVSALTENAEAISATLAPFIATLSVPPFTVTPGKFSGDGTTTVFTLPATPFSAAAVDVQISGIGQSLDDDYTISGTTLTFISAPPTGTDNVRVKVYSTLV